MNLNKYLIAAMLAVGMVGTISAQETRSHSYKNQQENQVLEEGAASSADYQTKQMAVGLGLNRDQATKIKTINLNHAKEIERAKPECGDDYAGFNQYVDKVAFVRDQELKSVLTPEQFAFYTAKKSKRTWLGMDKFKVKSDELRVKENRHELKIKGKASIATEDLSASSNENASNEQSSDAYSNSKNIIATPQAATPDYHNIPKDDATPMVTGDVNAGAPEVKTYPGELNIGEEYGVKPEYDDAYNPSAGADYGDKCNKAVSKKVVGKSAVKGNAKVAVKKSAPKKVAKSSTAGSNLSAKKAKPAGKKSSATAVAKKKSNTKASASAKSKKPVVSKPKPKPAEAEENTFSSGQTLTPAPNSDDFYDTTTSASAKESEPSNYGSNVDKFNYNISPEPAPENYLINKNSKEKFTDNEIKIKPEKGVKYKITDKETKLKDGKEKLKENDKEIKIKDGHANKIKSNDRETKIKEGDLRIKIKE